MHVRSRRAALLLAPMVMSVAACERGGHQLPRSPFSRRPARPDEMPALVSTELPFRYPAVLYARKAQGNVTLRLFVDSAGRVVMDSTRVEEPSGYPSLDSAAMVGANDLRFAPAKLHGEP